ncbi:hypothetical protein TNCV_1681931, partial [Trichonephila clavipes]
DTLTSWFQLDSRTHSLKGCLKPVRMTTTPLIAIPFLPFQATGKLVFQAPASIKDAAPQNVVHIKVFSFRTGEAKGEFFSSSLDNFAVKFSLLKICTHRAICDCFHLKVFTGSSGLSFTKF